MAQVAMRVARADPATRRTPASRSLERKLNALVQIQDILIMMGMMSQIIVMMTMTMTVFRIRMSVHCHS